MPFREREDVPAIIAGLMPRPYEFIVDKAMQRDLGYFAELRHGANLLRRFELYPYVVVGPGNARAPDERRIQLELGRRASNKVRDPPTDRVGVMLGLRDRDIDGSPAVPLVVAFSFGIYREMTTRSSIQFPNNLLLEAEILGASTFTKISRRMGPPIRTITLAMKPDILPLFLLQFAGHFTQTASWDDNAVAQIKETAQRYYRVPPEIQMEALELTAPLPTSQASREQRRVVARVVMQPVRNWRFAQSVQRAYNHACAACDIQLELIEAAHIDPVENETSSDSVTNGIALCALHHKAYDEGLLEIHADGRINLIQSRLDSLAARILDGGLERFQANLRIRLRLPDDQENWPAAEHFERRARYLKERLG